MSSVKIVPQKPKIKIVAKKKPKVKSIRNIIPGRIIKGDMVVSITFLRTNKNKWTMINTKKFSKDYNVKITNKAPVLEKIARKIISYTYTIRDDKLFKNFKKKENKSKDIFITLGNNEK